MSRKRCLKPVLCLIVIAVTKSGIALAQPVPIAPVPCESLGVTAIDEASPWININVENRTDQTLRIYQRLSDGTRKPEAILVPRVAERFVRKPGTTWLVEDEAGICLGAYIIGTQYGRVRIGEKELRVRHNVPPYRLKTFVSPGFSVRPDRNEAYIDGPTVASPICDALSLFLGGRPQTPCGGQIRPTETDRHLEFDLSRPVIASGARALGVISDSRAALHVFLDHEGRIIRSIQELESGKEAASERVEFDFHIGGIDHVLLVGPWGPGEFNRAQAKPLHGEGTTRATVKRISATGWTVEAPANSVGRLWNNADRANPIDLGLYRVSFGFTFELLPEGPE